MCLDIVGSRVRYKIAKEDFVVYKILNKSNVSPYQGFRYVPNTEYSVNKLRAQRATWIVSGFDDWEINEGLHAYVTYEAALNMKDEDEKIVLFTVPKGTTYVIGQFNEMVAQKMVTGSLKGIKR